MNRMIHTTHCLRLYGFMLFGLFLVAGAVGQEEIQPWEVIVCNPLLSSLEMDSTWAAAQAIGVKGIELNVSSDLICNNLFVGKETPFKMDTPENAKKVGEEARAHGLWTPVLCAPIRLDAKNFNVVTPEWAKTLIANAPLAGVKVIYFPITTGEYTKPSIADDMFIQKTSDLLKDLVEQGKKSQVHIAFENLSVYWNRPEIALKVLEKYAPGELGICLDPINLYWFGHPLTHVYEITRQYIPRAVHFHVKNVAHPKDKQEVVREPGWQYGEDSVSVDKGDLEFKKILGWLHNSGYRGSISIEDDSLGHVAKEQRVAVLQEDVQYLRDIVQPWRNKQ